MGERFYPSLRSLLRLKAEGVKFSIFLGRETSLQSATAKTHEEAVMDL